MGVFDEKPHELIPHPPVPHPYPAVVIANPGLIWHSMSIDVPPPEATVVDAAVVTVIVKLSLSILVISCSALI